jgi:hypothetical protein
MFYLGSLSLYEYYIVRNQDRNETHNSHLVLLVLTVTKVDCTTTATKAHRTATACMFQ